MDNGAEHEAAISAKLAPNVLADYFNSIKQAFGETQEGLERDKRSLGPFIFVFVFSLIPVIPFLLSKIMSLLFGSAIIGFRAVHFSVASFWFWWIVSFVATLSLLLVLNRLIRPREKEKKRWLSPAQMRFAYCYGAADELRKYLTNRRGNHLEIADKYVLQIGIAIVRSSTLDLVEGVYPYHYWQPEIRTLAQDSKSNRSIGLVVPRPKWYRLQPDTESILEAFRFFLGKLRDRLKDRKDLVEIESALMDLSRYLYTEIPEVSGSDSDSDLERIGIESLLSFAQQINGLPLYRSETPHQKTSETASQRIISFAKKLSWPFNQENLLLSFCAWYVLFLVLFSAGFYLAFRHFNSLKIDTTIVATLVGGPIATAITAATIPRLTKSA